jgi:hypothetical protein
MSKVEQGAVTCYLAMKNLSVAEITAELQSMYNTHALKYSSISRWRGVFGTVRTIHLIYHVLEGRLIVILRLPFSHYYSNFHSSYVRYFVTNWRSARNFACVCFTMIWIWKSSICAMFRIHWKPIKGGCGSSFSKSFSRYTRTRSIIWVWTYINRGRKLVPFEYFHHLCWAADPDDGHTPGTDRRHLYVSKTGTVSQRIYGRTFILTSECRLSVVTILRGSSSSIGDDDGVQKSGPWPRFTSPMGWAMLLSRGHWRFRRSTEW